MTTTSVTSGVTSSGITLNNGDFLIVSSGGTASVTVVNSGGVASILGVGSNTTINAGGHEFVGPGGVVTATIISGAGAENLIIGAGTAGGTMVMSGGAEIVAAGGVTQSAIVSAGGDEILNGSGATSISATVMSGGFQFVSSGGLSLSATLSSGGDNVVFSGGTAGFSVINGGSEIVFAGGLAGSGFVNSGGTQQLSGTVGSPGIGLDMTINFSGNELVASGGIAIANVVNSGGNEVVQFDGLAGGTQVNSGGFEVVSSGGIASGVTLQAGATQTVSNGGTAEATVVNTLAVQIIDNGGTLIGTVLNVSGGIDLPGLPFVSGSSVANFDYGTDLLTVTEGVNSASGQLSGDYTGEFFHAVSDGGTGTLIYQDGQACYCKGTRILTFHGETEVENLRVGDTVVTHRGDIRRIRWIGRRGYSGRFAAGNRDVLPVLIRAGALADNTPRRDLLVSPLHAMFLDDVLIPAIALVNGTSITQVEAIDEVEYFHIELDSHDIIVAEGALSETFVDDNSRGMFQNAAEYSMLYPDARPERPRYCAPRVEDGEILEAVRRKLAGRARPEAQKAAAEATPGKLLGCVDVTRRDRICGWAYDEATPGEPVRLRIYNNDVVLGEVIADCLRPDLVSAGIGNGRHGFELEVQGGLSPLVRHVIHVRRASDGQDLPNTPWVLKAEPPAAPIVVAPESAERRVDGCVDQVSRERITGWAFDARDPRTPVALQIIDNGVLIARVLANLHRADLEQAGVGNGRHGFDIIIPGALSPLARHVVQIRAELDGFDLPGSPFVLEPANSFDATLRQAVANAVASVAASGEQERVLSFILAQADRLRQQRADADGKRAERAAARQLQRRLGPDAGDIAEPARRALVIDTRLPRSTRDAGSRAILSHMRSLQRLGYEVSLVAADDLTAPVEAASELEALGIACHRAPFYSSVEDVLRRQAECIDVVYLHRADIATRYLTLARAWCPRAKIVYSVADLHHVRLERQAKVEGRPELLAASRRMRLMECTAAWSADAVITHSAEEAALLRNLVPEANVHRVGWEIPVQPTAVPTASCHGVAFIGGFGHSPNVDAARWLVETIMPLVWRVDPDIECLLVGSDMPASVRDLARPGVKVIGEVAHLQASVYDRVRLTVAPLRYGAGIKGKVLDGLAAGVPCVMSDIAAEGMSLPAALRGLVGRSAEEIAALICQMHLGRDDHDAAVSAGLLMIARDFNADVITSDVRDAVERMRQPMARDAG